MEIKNYDLSKLKVIWASFLDDTGQEIRGFFRLIEQTTNYVKLVSGKNILTIPFHRIIKLKEGIEDG